MTHNGDSMMGIDRETTLEDGGKKRRVGFRRHTARKQKMSEMKQNSNMERYLCDSLKDKCLAHFLVVY